jgi:cation diffusion facilitator CzcD-associated flavoprotein CzcO
MVSTLTVRNSNWKWPDVEGIDTFQGRLIHTAQWPKDFDHAGKTIAVIGNGSSGIQVLPELQKGKRQGSRTSSKI